MVQIQAAQHLFSSVERGYFPKHGRGFQTVAMTPELMGTEDLQVLEEVAFYALSRERRAAGNWPIKETFLALPSEKFAIGRTIYLGVDALGREGNYLSHHVIVNREALLRLGADPFVVLEAMPWADPNTDLKPRELPRLTLSLEKAVPHLPDVKRTLLADFSQVALDNLNPKRLAWLIGAEAETRQMLKALFAAVAEEERLQFTFATHFYDSEHLRNYFRLVAVETDSGISTTDDHLFDLNHYDQRLSFAASPYASWLASALASYQWEEMLAVNQAINHLRQHLPVADFPETPAVCLALWDRLGIEVLAALRGRATRLQLFLSQPGKKRELAESLLATTSPTNLLGNDAPLEVAQSCLAALESAVPPKVWREWCSRWQSDPLLAMLPVRAKSWWKLW